MRRRTAVLGAAASAMLAACLVRAQSSTRTYRVGILMLASGPAAAAQIAVAREQLAKHGFIDGRNLTIEVRHPSGFGPVPAAAAAKELVALRPDAVLSFGTALTQAVAAAGSSLPIVFAGVADPVMSGFVKDLGRPGGNVTGASNRFYDLTLKRLELARELLPGATRIALVAGYFDAVLNNAMQLLRPAADKLGLDLARIEGGTVGWHGVIQSSVNAGAQLALLLTPFLPFGLRLIEDDVIRQTIALRFPAILADVEAVDSGALMSYGNRFSNEIRRGVDLLARVLRGEKPADLSVDQAARFELAINLGTARSIGLKFPQSLLVRADRVIE